MITITGRAVDRQRSEPFPQLRIELWDSGRRLSAAIARTSVPTNEAGEFTLQVDDTALEEIFRSGDGAELILRAYHADGTELPVSDGGLIPWHPGAPHAETTLVVENPLETTTLAELNAVLGLEAAPELSSLLEARGIRTLADIRAAGGSLAGIANDVTADAPIVRAIEAHARLEMIVPDPDLSRRLIEAGITGVTQLAGAEAPALAERIGVDAAAIGTLRAEAGAYRAALANAFTDAAVSAVPGNQVFGLYQTEEKVFAGHLPPVAAASDSELCASCSTCRSALSPTAYLIDLIDFLIDNFGSATVSTAAAEPLSFPDLKSLDRRFRRSFSTLTVSCAAVEQPVRQIEIAIEVLERFITTPPVTGYGREFIYGQFDSRDTRGRPIYPRPDVLSRMFDAYLEELGIRRAAFDTAIREAYPNPPATPDLTNLNRLLGPLGINVGELQNGLNITSAAWKPHIKALDWMPELVRKAMTKGLDPMKVHQLPAYQEALTQAETSVDRVKTYALPDIRANLIAYALRTLQRADVPADLSTIKSAGQLGDYLHTDLPGDPCMMTTRIGSAIDTLQSFINAFRVGREDPRYYLSFHGGTAEGNFEARWRWLRSYSTWQAAQSVFLYPENFMLPGVRHDSSDPFKALLDNLRNVGGRPEAIRAAVEGYRSRVQPLYTVGQFHSHPEVGSGAGLTNFHKRQQEEYKRLQPGDPRVLYLDEWYFYLPLAVASFLTYARYYEHAAGWLNAIYYPFAGNYPPDFPSAPVRLVWWGLSRETDDNYRDSVAWLSDPFTPFAVARTRQGALVRHVVCRQVENLLDWADSEFARDTSESVSRARELYELAQDLLQVEEIPPEEACRIAWDELFAEFFATLNADELRLVRLLVDPLPSDDRVKRADITALGAAMRRGEPFDIRLNELKRLVDLIKERPVAERTLAEILRERNAAADHELALEDVFNRRSGAVDLATSLRLAAATVVERDGALAPENELVRATYRKMVGGFCVPPDPLLTGLRFRAETNLEKIRTCRNFAGMQRVARFYAPATDPLQAVQQVSAGENFEDAVPAEPPPIYRFSYLIEQARYFVQVAQQLEALLLQSFEKHYAEEYNLLKAHQDTRAADANIALQRLRVQEASNGRELAFQQLGRARFQKRHFDELLRVGLLESEKEAYAKLWASFDWTIAATAAGALPLTLAIIAAVAGTGGAAAPLGMAALTSLPGIPQGIASLQSIASQARSLQASYERRQEEWEFQRKLAHHDSLIGEQGVKLANDRLAITEQERSIAQLQKGFANEVVSFLGTKFTNKQLYDWMAQLVRGYYRAHLDFATVTARMAQQALAFERQETITFVAQYYAEREKSDLLMAERLLTDINRLDQHRLATARRRKELTKVISLGAYAPVEFERLRSKGWMAFMTPMEWFDRDWPGHYLRLIKSVSLTIVGLISPGEGVRATLSNNGMSRVMVGPPFEQPKEIQRQPESVAISAASNGTGLFELRLDDPMLLPFEGFGVETTWTLEMPKAANRFNYETLVDVLLTINYTALDDPAYRNKVVQKLGTTVERVMSFSLRSSYADAWYHLSNPAFLSDPDEYSFEPGQVMPPYAVEIKLEASDFPPNGTVRKMLRLSLALRQTRFVKVPVAFEFLPNGAAEDVYRLEADIAWDPAEPDSEPFALTTFSHRRTGSAPWQEVDTPLAALKNPLGRWRIRFRNDSDLNADDYPGLFSTEPPVHGQRQLDLSWLTDAMLVITYEAEIEYKFAPGSVV